MQEAPDLDLRQSSCTPSHEATTTEEHAQKANQQIIYQERVSKVRDSCTIYKLSNMSEYMSGKGYMYTK